MTNTVRKRGRSGRGGVSKVFMTLGNGFMGTALRSPLHGLVDRAFMLVTVTGRKSGRTYTTPVNYVREGDTVTVLSRRGRTWWRNLEGGAPVLLRLLGGRVSGVGRVLDASPEEKEREIGAFYRALGREPSAAGRDRLDDTIVIRITLDTR